MEQNEVLTSEVNEMWAIVELMGHGQTAGRISRPADWGGMLRVDVPEGDGYRSEFYSMSALYSVKPVSKEIATAYVMPPKEVRGWDTPIITREQHEAAVDDLRRELNSLRHKTRTLENRLVAVKALPSGWSLEDEKFDGDDDEIDF